MNAGAGRREDGGRQGFRSAVVSLLGGGWCRPPGALCSTAGRGRAARTAKERDGGRKDMAVIMRRGAVAVVRPRVRCQHASQDRFDGSAEVRERRMTATVPERCKLITKVQP